MKSPIEKAKKNIEGKKIYNIKKDDNSVKLGEFLGKVIKVNNDYTVLIENSYFEIVTENLVELNERFINNEITFISK